MRRGFALRAGAVRDTDRRHPQPARRLECHLGPSPILASARRASLPRRAAAEFLAAAEGVRFRRISAAVYIREFSLAAREFVTPCGGLFLFVPDLVRLAVPALATTAALPGSKPIPAPQALLSALALKLWSIERKSHVMALCADAGLALFTGLNAIPKKSFLSEYSHRIDRRRTLRLLG